MANAVRSEITPELEFLSPPAALACSQRLFTRCTFQLPAAAAAGTASCFVSYNSPFLSGPSQPAETLLPVLSKLPQRSA